MAHLHEGVNTPSFPQWTFFLCDLLSLSTPHWPVDSSIPLTSTLPQVHRFSGLLTLWLEAMPGTFLAYPGNTLQHPHTPSHGASCQWRLDTQVPRGEPTPRCQFGLHISASPCPCGTVLQWSWPQSSPLQPCCTILTTHKGRGRHQVLHSLLPGELGKGN